jgi:hypothetical protein
MARRFQVLGPCRMWRVVTSDSVALRKRQIPPLRHPGFPVEVSGVGELHAAFFTESPTRGHVQRCVAGNPGTLRSDDVTFDLFRVWGGKLRRASANNQKRHNLSG